MKKILFTSLFSLAIGALSILSPHLASAQESGIQISPVSYDYTISPTESTSGKFNLKNLDDGVLNYTLETELFSQVSEDGAPSFKGVVKPEGVTTLADWITFEGGKEGTIAANSQTDINFTITVPEGAEPGGHYAAIFAKQIKKDASGKTQLGIASRVGLLILVTVPGDITEGAKIDSFTFPEWVFKGPNDLAVRVENTGNVHFESNVKVQIKPLIGKTTTIDLGKHTILPENIRSYDGVWNSKYPFGYYKITATATDGNGQTMTSSGSIWAIPIVIVIPVILGVMVLWLLIEYIKKNFKLVKSQE